jgi:cellulose synthase/poly-beta-1,6-N-acetylglucosamine synthase-like glycosyltransferase
MNKETMPIEAEKTQHIDGITVVIPVFGDRLESCKKCIEFLNKQNVEPIEIIISEQGTTPIYIYEKCDHIFTFNNGIFNKSAAINIAVSKAKYQFVCMNDVDFILQQGFLKYVNDTLLKFEAGHAVKEIYYLDEMPKDNFYETRIHKLWSKNADFFCHGGNIFFKKDCFINIGGMNEGFVGHAAEDTEFYTRCKAALNFCDNRVLNTAHMPHPAYARNTWQKNIEFLDKETRNINITIKKCKEDFGKKYL